MRKIRPSGERYAPTDLEKFTERKIRILLNFPGAESCEVREGILKKSYVRGNRFESDGMSCLAILLERAGRGTTIDATLHDVRCKQERRFPYENIQEIYVVN